MKRFKKIPLWTWALAGALLSSHALAVGTRTFRLSTGSDLRGGDLKGVAVDSSGRVRAGFDLGTVAVSEATSIWAVLPRPDGSVLLGTGTEGKLVEVRGTATRVLAEANGLVITSLVDAWGGSVVGGTLPEGEVIRWDKGKLTTLVKLDEAEHVWDVAYDPRTRSVFAATGPTGKLYRIDAQGRAQVFFDAEEQQLMSVAVAPDGTVYAGASDKAKLYRIDGPGRATVLYDFGRTEVRAIQVAKDGTVFAVANEIQPGSYSPKRTKPSTSGTKPVAKSPKTKGKGTLYRFSPDGTPEQLLDDTSEHFVSVALDDAGRPYVGTGVEGRVYSVDANRNDILVADLEARQVGALVMSGRQRWIAASDPAALHPVIGIGGNDAVWTSKVLDAGLRARFGQLTWIADGALELSTRTGNTEEPDETWSAWSAPLTGPGAIQSPPARFVQVRARFNRDPAAVLREITIPFVTDNIRAVVTEVTSDGSSDATVGITSSGGPVSDSPNTKLSLRWKVDNPDKDELLYRLEYRLVGTTDWYDMLAPREQLTKPSYDWDTSDLPEGRYRVRVRASDELSNPPSLSTSHEFESGVVIVDNTPPSIGGLRVAGRQVSGVAMDGVGPISRIEISVAGSDLWYPFFPRDGVFDQQREEFEADVSSFAPNGHALLSIRVYDQANNFVVRNVALK